MSESSSSDEDSKKPSAKNLRLIKVQNFSEEKHVNRIRAANVKRQSGTVQAEISSTKSKVLRKKHFDIKPKQRFMNKVAQSQSKEQNSMDSKTYRVAYIHLNLKRKALRDAGDMQGVMPSKGKSETHKLHSKIGYHNSTPRWDTIAKGVSIENVDTSKLTAVNVDRFNGIENINQVLYPHTLESNLSPGRSPTHADEAVHQWIQDFENDLDHEGTYNEDRNPSDSNGRSAACLSASKRTHFPQADSELSSKSRMKPTVSFQGPAQTAATLTDVENSETADVFNAGCGAKPTLSETGFKGNIQDAKIKRKSAFKFSHTAKGNMRMLIYPKNISSSDAALVVLFNKKAGKQETGNSMSTQEKAKKCAAGTRKLRKRYKHFNKSQMDCLKGMFETQSN